MPKNQEEWLQIAEGFEKRWNFSHCLGSIDGKHCILQAPANSGSDYFNYKSTFSIVLLALVDYDYNFLFADVGCQGRISDGGVFAHTSFCKKLYAGTLKLPEESILPGRTENMENAFGILSSVFRVLRKPILLKEDNAALVVLSCVYLHNFLRRSKTSRNIYTPTGSFDIEPNTRYLSTTNLSEEHGANPIQWGVALVLPRTKRRQLLIDRLNTASTPRFVTTSCYVEIHTKPARLDRTGHKDLYSRIP
ncbi:unnamed protein product [Acanthoscelides obtectus]|uniref:DDE Tnp4 domain-containing protein n=1 Tax=Acanthoscelides obtectus TaxID=200917 RepID=A0A9P0Q930_ACAOB|nr:unnamed protein product [Acanthoscelides obtectus]CAK1689395.1 hypothetical protein AOBTE_LOCUS37221 [Acanthoscelides obtectus]